MSAIKYLDLDSSYRNRNEYPNPNDFVVPHALVRGSTSFTFVDPILESAPYTGSVIKQPGELVINNSPLPIDPIIIYLDPDEIDIDNYYIKNTIQIGSEFRDIVSYNGTNKSIIINTSFTIYPPAGTIYFISKVPNYFNSEVDIAQSDGNNVSKLSLLSPLVNPQKNFYTGSYIRFTNGAHTGDKSLVEDYKLDAVPVWEQPKAPGLNTYIDMEKEIGFLFRPSFAGTMSYITINLTNKDINNDPNFPLIRTLLCRIRKGYGLEGEIIYSILFDIRNIPEPQDYIFNFSSEFFNLVPSQNYTITFIDVTPGTYTSGLVNIFGIESTIQYVSFNTRVYPKMSIYMNRSNMSFYSQPDDFLYLLDNITENVSCAYSLRQLKSSYTGSSIRVRKSDNTEKDIGFFRGGLDITTLKDFIGIGDGFVSKWYDQSGNGNDAFQIILTNQPKIVDKGSVCIQNMSPCLTFDGQNDFLEMTSYPFSSSTSFSINVVAKINNYNSSSYPASYFYFRNNSSTQFLYPLPYYNQSSLYLQTPSSTDISTSTSIDDRSHIISYVNEGIGGTIYTILDGSSISETPSFTTISPSSITGDVKYIGRGQYCLSCIIQEMIFFTQSLDTTNSTSVIQNQLRYYSVAPLTNNYHFESLNPSFYFSGENIYSLSYDRNNEVLYIGSSNGLIVKWDGLSLNSLGGQVNGDIACMEFDDVNNFLYIGGNFTTLTQPNGTTISSKGIGKWNINTSSWSGLNLGIDSIVYTLKLNKRDNLLYVGGNFISVVSGPVVNRVAVWNISSSTWQPLGNGANSSVRCIEYDEQNKNVYIGGDFTQVDGIISSNRIAVWNETSSSWSAISNGLNTVCRSLKLDVDTNNLYIGGDFTSAGGIPNSSGIVKFNTFSYTWMSLDNGTTISVYSIDIDSSKNVYIGGSFLTTSGKTTNRLAMWNGNDWMSFETGLNNTVYTIKCDTYDNLFIGGIFTETNNLSTRSISKLITDVKSVKLYDQRFYPLLSGVDGNVRSIVGAGKILYIGGQFINSSGNLTNRVVKWDTIINRWYPLTDSGTLITGVNSSVYTIVNSYINQSIYVGGDFTSAGGTPVTSFARWDILTSTWNSVSPSLNPFSIVYTSLFDTYGEEYIYIGGNISSVGATPVNNIVRYSVLTNTWQPLIDSETLVTGVNGTVYSMIFNGYFYISGNFTQAGGKSISGIAWWDDNNQTWNPLNDNDTGLSVSNVYCFTFDHYGNLWVGGSFTTAGGKSANGLSKWDFNTQMWYPVIDSETGVNGVNGTVYSISYNNFTKCLVIGGNFNDAGGHMCNNFVKYDPSTSEFLAIGNGVFDTIQPSPTIYCQYIDDYLYLGGSFNRSTDNSEDIIFQNIGKVSF